MPNLCTLPLAQLTLYEAARPSAPPIPNATDQYRQQGKQLALIYRHFLMAMGRLGSFLAQIDTANPQIG